MTSILAFFATSLGVFFLLAGVLVAFDVEPEPRLEPRVTESEPASALDSPRAEDTQTEAPNPSTREEEVTPETAQENTTPPLLPAATRNVREGSVAGAALAWRRAADSEGGAGRPLQPVADPTEIVIPKISVSAPVLNPSSTDIAALDAALLRGAARYPTSARIGEDGTMIIFGHSSGRPVVINPNFKIFNRVSELEAGDEIRVRGGGWEEVYRVVRVKLVEAEGTRIAVNAPGKRLVLVTCNSLGAKEERYVVEAMFVGRFAVRTLPRGVSLESASRYE